MRALVDLSNVPGGRAQVVLDRFLAANPKFEPGDLTVIVTAGALPPSPGVEFVEVAEGDSLGAKRQLVKSLDDFLNALGTGQGVVASTKEIVGYLLGERVSDETDVTFVDLGEAVAPKASLTEWPSDFMPLEEAFDVLKQAIRNKGGQVPQNALRGALEEVDPRFHKDKGGPRAVDNPKFPTFLARKAKESGIVTISGPAGKLVVKLAREKPAKKQATSTARTDVGTTPATGTGKPLERMSDKYLHTLKSAQMGPFQQVREAIYDRIDDRLESADKPVPLVELLDGAVHDVRQKIDEAREQGIEYLLLKGQNLPWGRVRAFIRLLFVRQSVLLDGGTPVSADWSNLQHPVDGLQDNWRQILDSELVLFLLSRGCKIDIFCEQDLSGALYNTRTKLDSVQTTLGYMQETQRVAFDESYALVIRT